MRSRLRNFRFLNFPGFHFLLTFPGPKVLPDSPVDQGSPVDQAPPGQSAPTDSMDLWDL